ncbi:MAG TPA: ABC transporter ATP-binding protein [Planctomycetota bacterium]|jgi:ABC-type lipoprotein export system ATPase subunit
MLEIQGLTKSYAGSANSGGKAVTAIDDVSLTVSAGEFVAVQGASGCGKTTLLLSAGGLLAPTSGSVRFEGQDIYSWSPDSRAKWRASTIGFVFQQFHLIPYLSVLDNVLAPLLARPMDEPLARARQLLERFGLSHRLDHVPAALSAGEQQRTALARALLHRPKLLLCDEPTGNLDPESARTVLAYLHEFHRDGGAVLLVTHDAAAAAEAQKIVRLKDGRVC